MRTRWFRWEDPRSVGLFRLVLGLLLVADLASLWPIRAYLYGIDGVLPDPPMCAGLPGALSLGCVLPRGGAFVLDAAIAVAVLFAAGVATTVTKWIAAYLLWSVMERNGLPLAGDQVFGNFVFLLALARCGTAYSLDNWWRCRRLRSAGVLDDGRPEHARYRSIPGWPRALMILQLCLAFGVNGWAKTGTTYRDGTALYFVLANDRWVRFPPWWILATFGMNVLLVATWGAVVFERGFPLVGLGFVLRRSLPRLPRAVRSATSARLWGGAGLLFTATLLMVCNFGWFVPGTLAALLVLAPGEAVGAGVERLVGRPARSRPRCPIRPSTPPRRVATIMLTAVIGWHATTMVVNALVAPRRFTAVRRAIPSWLAVGASKWMRWTNTRQFWTMFAPNAPRARQWLVIDVTDETGTTVPAFDSRSLLGERGPYYVGLDRRAKIHARLLRSSRWRDRHATYLCRTWQARGGAEPVVIHMVRWVWPLLDPSEMAGFGPRDPQAVVESQREQRNLGTWRCHESRAIANPD